LFFFDMYSTSSSAVDAIPSMIRSFHCDARIVDVASFDARRNASERSNVGWLRIIEYTKPPRSGSFSTNSWAPFLSDSHRGSSPFTSDIVRDHRQRPCSGQHEVRAG
jgi:hypothetical protein